MNGSKPNTQHGFEVDDAPDLSTGDWPETFAKATVHHGGPPPLQEIVSNDSETDTKYYLVRAKQGREKDFSFFFKSGVVAVGWSHVRFRDYPNADELVDAVLDTYRGMYAEVAPQYLGRKKNEIRRFKRMRKGDGVVVPYGSAIRLARVSGEELYDERQVTSTDLANQRKVAYETLGGDLLTIPREQLSEGFSRRLRVQGVAVGDLREFGEEIENLFRTREGWPAWIRKKSGQLLKGFKDQLLQNIRSGAVGLEAGGYGLEKLVHELLELEGYHARILPKTAFPGFADADIHASKADRISETRLLVQVKQQRGRVSPWGARQLREVIEQQPEYADYKLVLVTSGDASPELIEECERWDIVMIDGTGLVEWIYELMGQISPASRSKLGITDVPVLADFPGSRRKGH